MTAVCPSCATPVAERTASCPVCGTATGNQAPASPVGAGAIDAQIPRLRVALADRYDLGDVVGRGGMAVVLRAHDRKHARTVAIKVLRPEIASAVGPERFEREVGIAARFTHPHILPLHDSGEADGVFYYVMPFAEGQTLSDRIRREGALPPREAVRIAGEIADALAYAHDHGVVHRDIKPANILLESGHAVVTDFGVAHAAATLPMAPATGERPGHLPTGGDSGELTVTGIALGTPTYMSPEQAEGREVDGRTDVYALGCVLHEMLTGRPPFTGDSARELVAAHTLAPPPAPRVRGAPGALGRIVQRALAKDAAERFPSAQAFAAALADLRFPSVRRRVAALGTAVVAIAAVVVFGLRNRVPLDDTRVVVFPFSGAGIADSVGEDIARAVYWALSMSDALRGQDGWPLLSEPLRREPRALTDEMARDLAAAEGAGRYVRGEVLLADSLRLHIVLGGARWGGREETDVVLPAETDAWRAGVRAAPAVLSWLLAEGEPVDTAALIAHPAAVPPFLAGERAYRRADFAAASDRYADAIHADSAFVLARVRAAQAASWNHRRPDAVPLLDSALARDSALPARVRPFLRALRIFSRSSFDADSAVAYLEDALRADPHWPEAWMALGEVYTHMMPGGGAPDSAAAAAFARVRQEDVTFTPVLYHLVPVALWRGDVAAARRDRDVFIAAVRARGAAGMADTLQVTLDVMVRCVERDLGDLAPAGRDSLLEPLKETVQWMVTAGLRQLPCAVRAARKLRELDPDPRGDYRFSAFLALQSVFVAMGRVDSLQALLAPRPFGNALAGDLTILDALAFLQAGNVGGFAALAPEAERWADSLRVGVRAGRLDSLHVWILGSWEAATGKGRAADALARRLSDLHDSLRAVHGRPAPDETTEADLRTLGWFVRSLSARSALAAGDSSRALAELDGLRPTERRTHLEWRPWSSQGWEQVTLAQLLLAAGRPADALRVASVIDAPASVPLVMYLPASLQVREEAARRLGLARAAEEYRDRLAALRSGSSYTGR